MEIEIGDKVHGKKFCYDRWYQMTGEVIKLQPDRVFGAIVKIASDDDQDYYNIEDVELIDKAPANMATQKQLAYIANLYASLGHDWQPEKLTKAQASDIIDMLKNDPESMGVFNLGGGARDIYGGEQ